MKKVIDGVSYNTETAKLICEQELREFKVEIGEEAVQLKQLYRTKSGKYFFYVKKVFPAYTCVNNDDLNPEFDWITIEEENIVPISYDLALQFASENVSANPDLREQVGKYFSEIQFLDEEQHKMQKKIYLSYKASWYLDMMVNESDDTYSSFIEKLIVNEYRRQYKEGIMNRDPFFEMKD